MPAVRGEAVFVASLVQVVTYVGIKATSLVITPQARCRVLATARFVVVETYWVAESPCEKTRLSIEILRACSSRDTAMVGAPPASQDAPVVGPVTSITSCR